MQPIEYDNSFDVGTNFSLRGNSNTFNHLYEYMQRFKVMPLHYANIRLCRTDAYAALVKIVDGIENAYPGHKVEVRRSFHIDIYDDLKKGNGDYSDCMNETKVIYVDGTSLSLMAYVSHGNTLMLEAYAGSDAEYDTVRSMCDSVARNYQRSDEIVPNEFFMITHDGQSLELVKYEINRSKFADFDIDMQYNDDFKAVAAHVESTLNRKDGATGIALLHGVYGSGKTTYLRHLISTIKKRVIYMPPDMANQLSSPAFFNFIRQYPNSVLIIEDAEDILRARMGDHGTAPAVSNLLNLSDGIMGDALNIQVVCTFNADIGEIDGALLRPGRLIAKYFFETLSPEKTKALVEKVHGPDEVPPKERMTVAEIYKMKEVLEGVEPAKKTFRIGFVPN